MKKILMICNYFAPDSTIGAVRTSKLVKYFRKSGYEVDFITEKKTIQRDELLLTGNEDVNIEYAENSRVYLEFRDVYEKLISPLRKKCMARTDNRRRINKKSGNEEFYPLQTAYPLLGSADYIVEQIKQNDLFRSIMRILDKADKYDYNYQYDGSTHFGGGLIYSDGSSIMNTQKCANVFTVPEGTGSQALEAVAFATRDASVGYSIQIYKNPTLNIENSDGMRYSSNSFP